MTQEEIKAQISVLENIGGYTIEIDELNDKLTKSFSIEEEIKYSSVDFASWLWTHCTQPTDFFNKWKYGYPEQSYTTEELYDIFLKVPNHAKKQRIKERGLNLK